MRGQLGLEIHAREMVVVGLGRPEELLELGARMLELGSGGEVAGSPLLGHVWRIDGFLQSGETAAARKKSRPVYVVATAPGWASSQGGRGRLPCILVIVQFSDRLRSMSTGLPTRDAVGAVALLGDHNRRQLYELVAASRESVGRDDAATALGISRELAAFHLDRLVAGGLLETEYRRRNGRTGPGAGRPAKLYRRAEGDIAVSLPHRSYAAAAEVFASALSRLDGQSSIDAVAEVARAQGTEVGVEARQEAGAHPSHNHLKVALLDLLGAAGYEPEVDPDRGSVRLRNCPYRVLASSHRDLTCGMNHAWAEGVVGGLADPQLEVELAPTPGYCCVVFNEAPGPAMGRSLRHRRRPAEE